MMHEYYIYAPCGDLACRNGRYYGHVRKAAHCRTTFSDEKAEAGEWPIIECEPYAVPLGLIEIKGMPADDMTRLKAARQPIDPASFERWEANGRRRWTMMTRGRRPFRLQAPASIWPPCSWAHKATP